MKLINVLRKFILFSLIFIFNLLSINAKERENKQENQEWFRLEFSLGLKENGIILANDTLISYQKEGTYILRDNQPVLSSNLSDTSTITEVPPVLASIEGKFYFQIVLTIKNISI